MSAQSTDPSGRTRARVDRLLHGITTLLKDGPQLAAIRDAAATVTEAASAPLAIAILAESTGDGRLASHHLWAPLLGAGAGRITPQRSAIGYVTAVRLRAADRGEATIRGATVSFMDQRDVARCKARMLSEASGEPTAGVDWPAALDQARGLWLGADSARRACLAELVAMYRAQIFAERFLGRTGLPVRLEAVHHATMPLHRTDSRAGQPPFPDHRGAGPYERDQELTQNALHRVFPVIRRVVVDVEVPQPQWPLGDDGLELVDLPMLDSRLRTGRADWLIETELASAGAVVTIDGQQREVERLLGGLRPPTPAEILSVPGNATVLTDRGRLDDLRSEIVGQGQKACITARLRRTDAAYETFRQTVSRAVSTLDEMPIAPPPPPSDEEMRLRKLLGRISTDLSAMIDDIHRGIAGPGARLPSGIGPHSALRQWVTAQVHGWPQWATLFGALRQQMLPSGAQGSGDELPARAEVLEMRFRTMVRELPEAAARVVDSALEAWLRRWSIRMGPLKVDLLDAIPSPRDWDAEADDTVAKLRLVVALGQLAGTRPVAAPPVDPAAIHHAFPLDPQRFLPWHEGAQQGDARAAHDRHQMTVMRVRRELVVAGRRLAEEAITGELTRRVDALRRALREHHQVVLRADKHVRTLLGVGEATYPVSPQALARRLERLLDDEDHETRRDEANK